MSFLLDSISTKLNTSPAHTRCLVNICGVIGELSAAWKPYRCFQIMMKHSWGTRAQMIGNTFWCEKCARPKRTVGLGVTDKDLEVMDLREKVIYVLLFGWELKTCRGLFTARGRGAKLRSSVPCSLPGPPLMGLGGVVALVWSDFPKQKNGASERS